MKLKQLRKERGLNQEDVATALNLSRTAYSYYETEKREPDIQTLIKLADYFKVSIDNLLEHEVPYLIDRSQYTMTQLKLIEKLKGIPDDITQKVEAYLMGALMALEERQPKRPIGKIKQFISEDKYE